MAIKQVTIRTYDGNGGFLEERIVELEVANDPLLVEHAASSSGVHGAGADNIGVFTGLVKLSVGAAAPPIVSTGDLWIDTS